jgi:hypothetical protein
LFLAAALVFLGASSSHGKYLLDTFEDDTLATPPNGPETGTATYGGTSATHTVISQGGSQRLRSLDSSTGGGILISYIPIASSELMLVEYLMRIEGGSNPVARNAFLQEIVLSPIGTNVFLEWGDDNTFHIKITYPAQPSKVIDTGLAWSFDTDYRVTWMIDIINDEFTLLIDDSPVLKNQAVLEDLTSLYRLSFATNFDTTGSQVIDDVTISHICGGPCTWYVDSSASGTNNGTNWTDAFAYLQDALFAAQPGDTLLVAQGAYKPDRGGGQSSGDREATFHLTSGITIMGGYAGAGEPDPDARDIQTYETVLTGDIGTLGNTSDNSYHVATGSGTDASAILDGFTITAGNATGSTPHNAGGGLSIRIGSPTILNCNFVANTADRGGAVSNLPYAAGDPNFINCKFFGNSATSGGGAMESQGGAPTLRNCIFSGNSSTSRAAGITNMGYSQIRLINCTLSGNATLAPSAGGLYNSWATATADVLNCILWNNTASGGTTESAQMDNYQGTLTVDYTCVEGWAGGLGGTGNIGDDPCFVDADGPDDTIGTSDDNVRLLLDSPCIDAGHPGAEYKDPDGSRNDMGAYGGLWADVGGPGSHSGTGFIFTSIGNIPFSEIIQDDANTSHGLADVNSTAANLLGIPAYTDSPFGRTLWVHGLFGVNDDVNHYQVLVAKWDDGNEPDPNDYVPLSDPLTKVRYFIDPLTGDWSYQYVTLGPKTIDGITDLYELTDDGYWSHIDVRVKWNTRAYENGKYTMTHKAYRQLGDGTLIDVTQPTPIDLVLVVDNNPVTAVIHHVKYDPCSPYYNDPCDGEIPECGIINLGSTGENLRFTITASHPTGYLRTYNLRALYGKNRDGGLITSDSYSPVSPPYWTGVTDQEFQSEDSGSLQPWQQCAYQFRLRAYSRATNGYHYIISREFNDHYYLNLGLAACGRADLDNSGKVNFRDFALFALHWLESCTP